MDTVLLLDISWMTLGIFGLFFPRKLIPSIVHQISIAVLCSSTISPIEKKVVNPNGVWRHKLRVEGVQTTCSGKWPKIGKCGMV